MRIFQVVILIFIILPCFASSQFDNPFERLLKNAISKTNDGYHEEAITICNSLIEEVPESATVFYLRGYNYFQEKKYDKAIQDFDRTLQIDPGYTDAYLWRSKARLKKNEFFGAVNDLNKAKNTNVYQTVIVLTKEVFGFIFGKDENAND